MNIFKAIRKLFSKKPINKPKYFKLTNEQENHHGFQYKDGLNVDILPFKKRGSCCAGGLYVTTAEHLMSFIDSGMKWVREVSIPEDETQWVQDGDKWRSHSLFCQPRKSLNDPATWQWLIDNGINIDDALINSAWNGHLEVVKMLTEKFNNFSQDSINDALKYSASNGHLEIVKMLTEKFNNFSQNAIDYALKYSAYNGYLEIVKILTEKFNNFSQDSIDDALINSACYGHLEVVKYLTEKFNNFSQDYIDDALKFSAFYGHTKINTYLKNISISNFYLYRSITKGNQYDK